MIAYHEEKIVSKFATVLTRQSNESFIFKQKTNFHKANIARKTTLGFFSCFRDQKEKISPFRNSVGLHVDEILWVVMVDIYYIIRNITCDRHFPLLQHTGMTYL